MNESLKPTFVEENVQIKAIEQLRNAIYFLPLRSVLTGIATAQFDRLVN